MGDSPLSDSILGTPSDSLRCSKTDGKLWRCSEWKFETKSMCQKHYLKQCEYHAKKKHALSSEGGKKKRTVKKKTVKKSKRNVKNESVCSDDDSIEKMFGDSYPTEDENDDDSIEKLFDDNYTSSSDESCKLVPRKKSKVNSMSDCAKDEVVEELDKNQD